MLQNIKARLYAKKYFPFKGLAKTNENDNYFIYNNTIYYGNRFFIFFKSCMNETS